MRTTSTSSRPIGSERKNTRYCVPFSKTGWGGGVWAADGVEATKATKSAETRATAGTETSAPKGTEIRHVQRRLTIWVTINQLRTCFPWRATRLHWNKGR